MLRISSAASWAIRETGIGAPRQAFGIRSILPAWGSPIGLTCRDDLASQLGPALLASRQVRTGRRRVLRDHFSTQRPERTLATPTAEWHASCFRATTCDLSPPPPARVRIHAWYGEPSAGLPGTIRPAVKSRGAVAFLGCGRWRFGAGLGQVGGGAGSGESAWSGLPGPGRPRCRGSRP